jgi:hypothetical protein
MRRTACTQPQCLYKGTLYPYQLPFTKARIIAAWLCLDYHVLSSSTDTVEQVQQLAMGYTVRGSNPGGKGEDFQHSSGLDLAHPMSYTMGTESFPGINRPGRDVNHPPRPAPRLKKKYSSTSSSPSVPSWHTTGWTFTFLPPIFETYVHPSLPFKKSAFQ